LTSQGASLPTGIFEISMNFSLHSDQLRPFGRQSRPGMGRSLGKHPK
jgi:hypothetical protein